MKVYGLTGGVGMGKSTTDKLLRDHGVAVVDTDLIARQLVEPGEPALAEIQALFGADIVDVEGRLRRKMLARLVFADVNARKRLENILHPRIQRIWQEQIETWRAEGRPQAVVVIPLLFETKAETRFDAIICVACSAATQLRRLEARGWSQDEIEHRIRAQWPAEKKMELANYVIWTEGDLDIHAAQLERIIA
ncbi:MAG TPA: dephospho-CoA kinase [Verrucomicrobiae bacterium]|nr:dephospho-CoA kinase [Verrucomicrobiae bacterium]